MGVSIVCPCECVDITCTKTRVVKGRMLIISQVKTNGDTVTDDYGALIILFQRCSLTYLLDLTNKSTSEKPKLKL